MTIALDQANDQANATCLIIDNQRGTLGSFCLLG